ncbi:MAG: hypothetical protein IH589_14620 [Anaerolineales bacterium]|nr:hypothetical protein [Anaerolineales bacterium]
MRHRSSYSVFLAACYLFALLALFVSSCKVGNVSDITGITPTPMTPSPTPRVCPPNINLDGLDGLKIQPTFIVVLFDANSIYTKPIEYISGKKTTDAMEFVGKILPELLGPGDQYSIFSLGFRHYEAAKLDRYSSKISEAPEIVSTPEPHITLTIIPTPTISGAVLENQVAKNEYEENVDSQNATATQSAFEYNCELLAYDTTYKLTATAWGVTKQAEANEIATQIVVAQSDREEKIQIMETPFAPDNVYEGLSHVTVDFENQCKNYDRCILILFDDLVDWRPDTPDYLDINLEGVDVISILPQCEDIIQPSCKRVQDIWRPLFVSYKAKSVEYYNGERLEEALINYFGGK